jgi:hypothetical protein
MLVLNAGISYNSKDWLMWLTIEKWRDKKRTRLREEMLVQFQTGTPFGYWIITRAVDLGFWSGLYGWKAKT